MSIKSVTFDLSKFAEKCVYGGMIKVNVFEEGNNDPQTCSAVPLILRGNVCEIAIDGENIILKANKRIEKSPVWEPVI